MAKSEQYRRSVLEAFDELKEIYCEPCHQTGNAALAEWYCVDCPEYLCGPCYKIHREHKALANHVLLDKHSMPFTTDSNICKERCSIHTNKVIELFCETCDKLVCTICLATDHCQCEKVKHIPDIVKDLEHTREFKKFNYDIKSNTIKLAKHEKMLQKNVTSNKGMRTLAKKELKHQRDEVNRFFDQLEKKIDEEITSIEAGNQDTLKDASKRLDYIKTDLDQINTDIEVKNKSQRCKLFIAMKRSQKKIRTFDDQFDRLQQELKIEHYALVPSEKIQAMMRTTTEICRIASVRFESEIDKQSSTNRWGLTLYCMHGQYCVASGKGYRSIKVIDTNSKCVTSEIFFEVDCIGSVTSVSNDQVAVALSLNECNCEIQFFTVSASGVLQRTNQLYNVEGCYYSMVHCAGNIYGVLHYYSSYIEELNMTRKVTRTIYTEDEDGLARIAVSPDGQTLYVTDDKKHSVTSMTLDGTVNVVYQDNDLKNPGGITVDKYGYVYVCSQGTKNIQQFTANLKKVQVAISNVVSNNITYSSTGNKLYICDGNQINQYSLDFK